jgi:tetratricopeptide (TPR) repeat protein
VPFQNQPDSEFFQQPAINRNDLLSGMRKSILLISLLTVAVPGWVSSAHAQNAQQLVQDAMQKQQTGDLAGAVTEYREFLKLHPEATAIHSNLGAALAGWGRFEEAVSEYKTALRQSPRLPGARLNLALAYYKMGRIADAATELARVHAEDPANHQAALLLGDCYLRMGQNKDVVRVLDPEQTKYPKDKAVAYLLGTALIRDKQVEKGQALVDRIFREGESAEAHLMLGEAKMDIADYAGARDEFAKAVTLNPKLPEVHMLYAQALHMTGDSDQSAKEFKAELANDPYNFESNLQLGATAREEQKYDEAQEFFTRALETRPGDPGVRYQLALIDVNQGRLDAALPKLESLVKEYPQFTEAHVSLSMVYFRLKRPEDGKRERDIVQKLTAEAQAKQPGAKVK